jgi:hypothetical protein
MGPAELRERSIATEIDRLVDAYRVRCLWFLRPDWYPVTQQDRLRALGYLERCGDQETFRRAATLRRWLSHTSNAPSAVS